MTDGEPQAASGPWWAKRWVVALAGVSVLAGALTMAYLESARRSSPSTAADTTTESGFRLHERPRSLPELRFTDESGKPMTLADFRGKTVLLNIWATWCPPCRKEMPSLDRLQAELGGPDFEVVALSIDHEGVGVVKSFYQQLGLRALRIYVDAESAATSQLGVVGVPTTLLIDREGRELGRKSGPAEWDSPAVVELIRPHLAARSER
jgi:thiol-disulfide isomerase/thioredoxin